MGLGTRRWVLARLGWRGRWVREGMGVGLGGLVGGDLVGDGGGGLRLARIEIWILVEGWWMPLLGYRC